LIDGNLVKKIAHDFNINITGVLHIGAHDCEELGFYNNLLGITPENIIWIDAIEIKVAQALANGIPNVYHHVITDKDDEIVDFHISNNGESSSILYFKTHSEQYPHIQYINTIQQKTITIDTFFKKNTINSEKYNFWNFDIQGAELMALKGAMDSIKHAKMLYLEVNIDELYEGCPRITDIDAFLEEKGFRRIHLLMSQHGWGDAIYIRV